jgi:transcriptional regulator with XRE-family HTH domain
MAQRCDRRAWRREALLKNKQSCMKAHSYANKPARGKLCDRLRIARHRAEISQTVLAHAIGVSPSAVAQWEHPQGTQPSLENLLRAAEVTGTSIEWLATGTIARASVRTRSVEETPAVALDTYAQTLQEETLLERFRNGSANQRTLLLKIAEEFVLLSRVSKQR